MSSLYQYDHDKIAIPPQPQSREVVENKQYEQPSKQGNEFVEVMGQIRELNARSSEFLKWVSKGGDSPSFLRWDLISKTDVHIVHKLVQYLTYHLKSPQGQRKLYNLYHHGTQCGALEAAQQEMISKYISMDICAEVEWYKLAHLAWPEAKTFLDIGANKGFLGSLFLSLWGGGKLRSAPQDVFNAATEMGAWKTSRNPSGYCKDGNNLAIPLHCPIERRDEATGRCEHVNPSVRLFSLDGSSYLTETLTSIIKTFPSVATESGQTSASQMWTYKNFALSDTEGTARFTKQSREKNPGFEGGGIKASASSGETTTDVKADILETTEEVKMTSVDIFAKTISSPVDFMKIDTEGNDNKVLRGAKATIASSVGMFTFEGGKGVTFSKDMIVSLDKIGFSCYSMSRAGLFKWNGGCTKDKYMGGFLAKDKGNIFCASRIRAPLIALAYDILTFPEMIKFIDETQNLVKDSQQLKAFQGMLAIVNGTIPGKDPNTLELPSKVDPAALVPLYVNKFGFCKPWPSCAGDIIQA